MKFDECGNRQIHPIFIVLAEKFLRSSRNCKQFDHASCDWSNCVTHDLNNRRERSESFLVNRRRRRRQRTTKLTPHTIADNKCAH